MVVDESGCSAYCMGVACGLNFLCLEGKSDKAARLVCEITGLLISAEIDLGPEYLVEVEVRNAMPKM